MASIGNIPCMQNNGKRPFYTFKNVYRPQDQFTYT